MGKPRHTSTVHRKSRKTNHKTRKNIETPIIVGVIHANWCGHCQALMPKWRVFKNELKHSKKVTIIDIEDSDSKKDAKMARLNVKINDKSVKLQANGFPTIFKIHRGHLQYYNGNREPAQLKQWALGYNNKQLPKLTIFYLYVKKCWIRRTNTV